LQTLPPAIGRHHTDILRLFAFPKSYLNHARDLRPSRKTGGCSIKADHLRLVVSIRAAWHIELVSSANNYLVHEVSWCPFLDMAMSGDDRFEQQVAVPKDLTRNALRFDRFDTKGLL
jgi:hypothetical protein